MRNNHPRTPYKWYLYYFFIPNTELDLTFFEDLLSNRGRTKDYKVAMKYLLRFQLVKVLEKKYGGYSWIDGKFRSWQRSEIARDLCYSEPHVSKLLNVRKNVGIESYKNAIRAAERLLETSSEKRVQLQESLKTEKEKSFYLRWLVLIFVTLTFIASYFLYHKSQQLAREQTSNSKFEADTKKLKDKINDLTSNLMETNIFKEILPKFRYYGVFSKDENLPCFQYEGVWEIDSFYVIPFSYNNKEYIYISSDLLMYTFCDNNIKKGETLRGISIFTGEIRLKNDTLDLENLTRSQLEGLPLCGRISTAFLDKITLKKIGETIKPIRRKGETIRRYNPEIINEEYADAVQYWHKELKDGLRQTRCDSISQESNKYKEIVLCFNCNMGTSEYEKRIIKTDGH